MKRLIIMLIVFILSLGTVACSENKLKTGDKDVGESQSEIESEIKQAINNSTENDSVNQDNAAAYEDYDESDILDAIIYNGERYCGLGMKWELENLPDDFELVGEFSGELTEKNEELSSTMIFRDGEKIYHYVDEEGYHYFCVK